MFPVFEQVAEMNRAYVANMLKGMDAAVAFSTKASSFGVQAASEFAAATTADLHALAAVKAPQDFVPLRAKQLEEKAEWAASTSRTALDMVASAQTEAFAFAEQQAAEAAKAFVANLDRVAKAAPQNVPGADYAVSAMKAAVETSMAAFETVAKATKEGVEFAGSQVKAAAKVAPKAAAKRR
ncbi:MAG: phasin family protein [Casimicrobium sp.]